jgi:hypothetical protein
MPTWLAVALSRVEALFARRRLDDDFDEEVAAHIALLTEDNIRRGMTPGDARRSAGGPPRTMNCGFRNADCGSRSANRCPAICDPRSAIRDPRSAIRNPQSAIRNPH